MGDGMLSLSWNNHSSTFSHMLSSLRHLERYTDVTVSCDGEFYCVHKFVLSTCSDYFTKIFERTPCKHPVIVLKDIQSKEMEALLNYMYVGQVSVAQSDLAQLIKIAELLQIKGLAVPDEPFKNLRKVRNHSEERPGPQWKWQKKPEGDTSQDLYIVDHKSNASAGGADSAKQQRGMEGSHGANAEVNDTGNENDVSIDNAQVDNRENNEHRCYTAGQGQENHVEENAEESMEENVNHAGLIRMGENFHNRDNSDEQAVEDQLDDNDSLPELSHPLIQLDEGNEEFDVNRENAFAYTGSGQYIVDGRSRITDVETSQPQLQVLETQGCLRSPLSQVEIMMDESLVKEEIVTEESLDNADFCSQESEGGGDTEENTMSLAAFRYDRMLHDRVFYHNHSQEMPNSDGQPGPSLLYGMNEPNNHDIEGSVGVESLRNFTEEAFQNPYYLYSNSEQNECMSPELRMYSKRNKRPYACAQCRYCTSSKSNLVIHMRTHTGERPYSCPECPFSASFEYNLKVHMRTHTGEKPFVCPHCPVKFAQKSHLKNHLFTHTGEKPYVCEHCSTKFSRRSNLRRHLIKHQ